MGRGCVCAAVNTQNPREKVWHVKMKTTMGDVEFILYNETPLHRDNFIRLVKSGFYKGILFHRVIRNFVVQGGDPDSRNAVKGQQLGENSFGEDIPAEIRTDIDIRHRRGSVMAAREPDEVNPLHKSSASQFCFMMRNAPHLDGSYTVFGEVTKGMDVLDKIQQVATDSNDRPLEDIQILRMKARRHRR